MILREIVINSSTYQGLFKGIPELSEVYFHTNKVSLLHFITGFHSTWQHRNNRRENNSQWRRGGGSSKVISFQ